jgi:hypothetical protein
MNPAAKVIDKLVNPPRVSDLDRLRDTVAGATVLVTGASFGIGEATARKLAAAGATVALTARSGDRLAELARAIGASGGHAALIHTRMSAPTASLRNVPGLTPDEAADIVAKAIIERPRTIAPWWLWPAEVTTVLLRSPVERVTQLWWRHTTIPTGGPIVKAW